MARLSSYCWEGCCCERPVACDEVKEIQALPPSPEAGLEQLIKHEFLIAMADKLLNQLAKLPLRAFIYSLEMFVQTARGLQELASQGIDSMMSADAPTDSGASAAMSSYTKQVTPDGFIRTDSEEISRGDNSSANPGGSMVNGAVSEDATTNPKERVNMRDANLSDDMLKLVRFKILFVKREYEVAFPEDEDLVPDNMTGSDFAAWKVAEFIQRLSLRPPEIRFPKRWLKKTYFNKYSLPKNWEEADTLLTRARKAIEESDRAREEAKDAKGKPEAERKAHEAEEAARRANEATKRAAPYWLIGFPEDDKKYLRVFYEVLERYPREKLRYEERQLEILEKIADGVNQ